MEILHPYPRWEKINLAAMCVTVATLIALPCWFRVIKAALDDLLGLTSWTRDTIWPAQLTDRPITLYLIDQMLDVDLQRWTPVRGWDMGGHQYTTSSHATTLESNKSVTPMILPNNFCCLRRR